MTGRVATQLRKAIPESVRVVSSMDLPPRQPMRMTTHDCQRTNQREAAHPATGRVVGLLLMGWTDGEALAATGSASTAVTSTSTAAASAAVRPRTPADTASPVRAGEKTLTCTDWATAKAGALKAVPGGTAYRAESDADGATCEAYVTKADGTHAAVKFDKSFEVTAVQNGRGGRTWRRNGPPQTRGNPSGFQRSRPLIGHRPCWPRDEPVDDSPAATGSTTPCA